MSSRSLLGEKITRHATTTASVSTTDKAGDEASACALRLAHAIERSRGEGRIDLLTTEALQAIMAAACKVYAARVEAGQELLPLTERSGVTATDVMTTASGLLRAVNLAVFELGMWQSWTGR